MTVSYSPKHFPLKAPSNLLDLCLADSRIMYFWQVLEFTHKFIVELRALQCLIIKGSNKQQRRSTIIQTFTKEQTFSSLMTTKSSWGWSHNSAYLLLASSKKDLPLLDRLAKKRIYLDSHLKGELADLFWKCHGVPYSHS